MNVRRYGTIAMGLGIALALSAMTEAAAQTDTTRRPPTSDVRIPVQKRVSGDVTRRESGGEVAIRATTARIDSLEALSSALRSRLDSLEAAASRSAALEVRITALSDSLSGVHDELAALREELAALTARTAQLDSRVTQLNQRFSRFRNGSVFGNSGFYVGLGTGFNYTTGTLRDIGYEEALHVTVPIGWQKLGRLIGVRTEWSYQRLEGVQMGSFTNLDPEVYSGLAMLTMHVPLNDARTHNFFLMGGGGVYVFKDFGLSSSLAERFSGSLEGSETETKWGFNAGAGFEFRVLGATSLFLQSSFTNIAADRGNVPGVDTGRNLQWVPLLVGVTIR